MPQVDAQPVQVAKVAKPGRAPRAAPSWSRTGCVTCKRRRKKCDQGRPGCVNCTRRGKPCEGYQQPFVAQAIRGCPVPPPKSSTDRPKKRASPVVVEAPESSGGSEQEIAEYSFYRALLSPGHSQWQSLLLSPLPLSRLGSPIADSPMRDDHGDENDHPDGVTAPGSPHSSQTEPSQTPAICGMASPENGTRLLSLMEDDVITHYEISTIPAADALGISSAVDDAPCGTADTEVSADGEISDDTIRDVVTDNVSNNTVPDATVNAAVDAAKYTSDAARYIADISSEWLRQVDGTSTGLSPSSEPHLLPTFPQFSDQDVFYIQYLYDQGARQLLNMDAGPQNPLRCLFLPRALQSTGVLHAMCAVSACHRARQADPDTRLTFSMAAARFYSKATAWLRTSLETCVTRMCGRLLLDDTSLFTAILLCKYEIIHGSVRHWNGHLRGLENMFQSCGGTDAIGVDCRQYISSFIRYHRTVGSITNASVWMQTDGADENDGPDDALDDETSPSFFIDPYSGCSYYLLCACRSISELAGQVEKQSITSFSQFSAQVNTIVTTLGSSNIQLGEQPCPAGVTMAQIGRLLFVAQRIRYATFVFLHAMIEYAESTLIDVEPAEWRALIDGLPYAKARAVDGCLDMLETLPVGAHCEFAALTLPLFIAGCETGDPRQRYFVLDRLFLLEKSVAIGNITRARDALVMIWQQTDSTGKTARRFWWKILQEMGWELILS
ncbi:hypothetical protein HMPREF1624_07711 [Sporothrix schenckii ATCC 58251]|uniref:Zn(2)-C6 fungal-type domain-containing protein n=1 Tax=Sporothrix schenckii (strain ATCC 58251 / de Perez 2211183) TaxID=1391915 RepID=U7PNU8_SPOS1|nr:hypothetical protein HMPREF1624_07711 [Sporothrix schenckii ATCC 58251]